MAYEIARHYIFLIWVLIFKFVIMTVDKSGQNMRVGLIIVAFSTHASYATFSVFNFVWFGNSSKFIYNINYLRSFVLIFTENNG